MTWLKSSDASYMHPVALQAMEHDEADDRTLNELFGCFARCAAYVATYEGDYVIQLGAFKTIAGISRWKALEAQGVAAGYVTRVRLEDGSQALKLVEDEDLFNMIPRSAREWTNQRKADARNPRLTVPVRIRDGDGCRYCGDVVIWGDQKSARGATYDHRRPGKAGTTDTFVVSCRSCNSSRLKGREEFDREHPLLPEPQEPFYSRSTAAWLAKHGKHVTPSDGSRATSPVEQANGSESAAHSGSETATAVDPTEQMPDSAPDPVSSVASGQANGSESDTRPESVPATAVEHTGQVPDSAPDPEPLKAPEEHENPPGDTDPADSGGFRRIRALPDPDLSGRVMGRVGSGQEGPAQAGSGGAPAPPPGPRDPPCPQESSAQDPPGDGQGKRRRRRKRRKG